MGLKDWFKKMNEVVPANCDLCGEVAGNYTSKCDRCWRLMGLNDHGSKLAELRRKGVVSQGEFIYLRMRIEVAHAAREERRMEKEKRYLQRVYKSTRKNHRAWVCE